MRFMALFAVAILTGCGPGSSGTTGAGGSGGQAGGGPGGAGGTGGSEVCGASPHSDDPAVQSLIDFTRARMAVTGTPGVAVAIVQSGAISTYAFGVKSQGTCDPVTVDTRFRLGPVTIPFTAAAVLSAVDSGHLSLDTKVTELVPDLTTRTGDPGAIKLEHLLTDTSGYDPAFPACSDDDPWALDGWFSMHPQQDMWFEPGAMWNFSLFGWSLSGVMLERALAGLRHNPTFDEILQERVLDPLGIQATTSVAAFLSGDHADGYGPAGHLVPPSSCAAYHPNDQLFASAPDLARLARMLLAQGGGVLSPRSAARMLDAGGPSFRPHFSSGMPFQRIPWAAGIDMYGWDGYGLGYTADFDIVPARNFAAVVVTNSSRLSAYEIADAAVTALLQLPFEPKNYDTDPSTWSDYVGTYLDPIGTGAGPRTLTVALEGGMLTGTFDSMSVQFQPGGTLLDTAGADLFTLTSNSKAHKVRFWRSGPDAKQGNVVAIGGFQSDFGPPAFKQ